MGNFYTNITLRGPEQRKVAGFLNSWGRTAFVSPRARGCVVVYDEHSETQDTAIISKLSSALSEIFDCPALAVVNHDDDIFWYGLHGSGKMMEEYESHSGSLIERAIGLFRRKRYGAALCRAFEIPCCDEVRRVLQGFYMFAVDRHEDLVRSLGAPELAVGVGFNYIIRGDVEFVKPEQFSKFVKTG